MYKQESPDADHQVDEEGGLKESLIKAHVPMKGPTRAMQLTVENGASNHAPFTRSIYGD
jgi:hypothetical protein